MIRITRKQLAEMVRREVKRQSYILEAHSSMSRLDDDFDEEYDELGMMGYNPSKMKGSRKSKGQKDIKMRRGIDEQAEYEDYLDSMEYIGVDDDYGDVQSMFVDRIIDDEEQFEYDELESLFDDPIENTNESDELY